MAITYKVKFKTPSGRRHSIHVGSSCAAVKLAQFLTEGKCHNIHVKLMQRLEYLHARELALAYIEFSERLANEEYG